MHKFAVGLALLATLALAACNDSSDFAGSPSGTGTGTGTPTAVSAVKVSANSATIPADSSSGATVQALVLGAGNVAISGATVSFAATSGALENVTATTNSSGIASATLLAVGTAAGSQITVSAAVGGASGNVNVGVVNNQQTITLLTSLEQLPSNGSTPATITAIVRNASNQLVPGAMVNFSASSGAIVPVQTTAGAAASPFVAAGTTDANGQAQATLSTPGDPSDRSITVTASVGSTTSALVVAVVGTTLSLTGPTSLIDGATGTFSVSLTDSGGNAIAGQAVVATSTNGNTITPANVTTDNTGHANFNVTAAKAGNDTIQATALGLTATAALQVSSQSFNFTSPASATQVDLGVSEPLTITWTNAGAPVTGQTVTFSTTRGLFSNNSSTITQVSSGTGTATVSLSADTAGPAIVTATAASVSAQLPLTFVATTPASIDVQANPSTIETNGQSTIIAIVRDANNNLVEGQTVDFQLNDKTGGSISVASAVTDVQGQAETVYTATSTASTSNGVQITATVQGVPAATVDLTVGGQTVFLSLGTGSVISENAAKTQFSVPFVIQALDSAGNAVPGVTVSLDIHSLPPNGNTNPATYTTAAYAKGTWANCGGTPAWTQNPVGTCTGEGLVAYCVNEDVNGTGIYEAGEDYNGNDKLDPGDVAAVTPGQVVTDSTGTANVAITYPEDHALWVQAKLTATTTVNGTQTTTTAVFWLPMLASYLTNSTVSPPGLDSPYGTANNCANPN